MIAAWQNGDGGMDDDGATDGGAPVPAGGGGAPVRTDPYRTPTGVFVLTGALMVGLVILGALVSTVALGFSAMCTDDFDASDCGAARAAAMVPVGATLVGAVGWGIGWARRRTPVGIGWAWGGVGVACFGLALIFVSVL